jgi:hypothetical protein
VCPQKRVGHPGEKEGAGPKGMHLSPHYFSEMKKESRQQAFMDIHPRLWWSEAGSQLWVCVSVPVQHLGGTVQPCAERAMGH